MSDDDTTRAEPIDTELNPRGDVVQDWRDEGYTSDFEVTTGGAIACGCGETHPPEEFTIEHEFRYEGHSNPGDEEILVAATAPCGDRGTLTLAYGPTASADEAEASRRLPKATPEQV